MVYKYEDRLSIKNHLYKEIKSLHRLYIGWLSGKIHCELLFMFTNNLVKLQGMIKSEKHIHKFELLLNNLI